jgi:hypothetical protein
VGAVPVPALSEDDVTDDEIREYATTLILDHARDVEYLSIHEMAEQHAPSGEISDEDARKVDDLITKATVTVSWPKYAVGKQIRFPLAGHVYRITAVDEPVCGCEYHGEGLSATGHHPDCPASDQSQRRVRFAPDYDPKDEGSETVADLDRADVQVFGVATTGSDAR